MTQGSPLPPKPGKNLRSIGALSILTVLSRILGLARDSLALATFGTTWLVDAFVIAFNLPNLFRRLLAEGSLTAAFVPTLQEELGKGGKPRAFALLSQVASWLLLITGGMVLVAAVLFSHARALTGHAEKWYVAADLSALLFPYLIFVCLAAAFSAALNVFGRFVEPALNPIWLNLAMIASLGGSALHFARTPLEGIHWWCWGVLIGGFLQMAVPALVLVREGWRPHLDLALSPRVREIARLIAPGLFGTAIYQINFLVSRLLAFSLPESSVTYYFTMNRLMEFPIGVFAIAVTTVVYPLIARHAVEGNTGAMAADFRKGIRMILAINVPAAAGMALLSGPIVALIYRHGRVSEGSAGQMAALLALFAIGMPFFSVVNLTVRAFYAVKDMATPVRIAAIDFCVNVVLSLILKRWFGVAGLVMASTSAIIVQTVLLERALVRRLPGLSLRPLLPSLGKVLAATAAMAAVVLAGRAGLDHLLVLPSVASTLRTGLPHLLGPRGLSEILDVGLLIPAGVGAYAVGLWLLRIEGWDELAAAAGRVLGRVWGR